MKFYTVNLWGKYEVLVLIPSIYWAKRYKALSISFLTHEATIDWS